MKEIKSKVVPTRLSAEEAQRLAEMAQQIGRTPSGVLRLLVRQATLDEQGQVVAGGAPVLPANGLTAEQIDEALEALDQAEKARALLATVRVNMTANVRYRL